MRNTLGLVVALCESKCCFALVSSYLLVFRIAGSALAGGVLNEGRHNKENNNYFNEKKLRDILHSHYAGRPSGSTLLR